MTYANKKIIVASVPLVILVFVAGIWIQVVSVKNRAETFLQQATALELRSATQSQVEELVTRFGGHREPSTCDKRGCAYFVSFENSWLHRLHLAPRTQLTTTLGVVDGALGYRRVFLGSGNSGSDYGALIQERLVSPKGIADSFLVSGSWSGKPYRVFVDLTPEATREQHKAAYDLNLECLTKLGGCENAQQLLPSIVWKGTS